MSINDCYKIYMDLASDLQVQAGGHFLWREKQENITIVQVLDTKRMGTDF